MLQFPGCREGCPVQLMCRVTKSIWKIPRKTCFKLLALAKRSREGGCYMRILVVTQYFWPESFIINDLVKALTAQGHDIKVLTGKPNYPDGVVFSGYTASGYQEEKFESCVSVCRAPLRPRGTSGAKNLVLNYLSFILNGLKYYPRAVKDEAYDAIFVFAPSPI